MDLLRRSHGRRDAGRLAADTAQENFEESRTQGLPWGSGFAPAHRALGSAVQRVEGTVSELEPAWLGAPATSCSAGPSWQHLRDPVGALERMRSALRPAESCCSPRAPRRR